MIIRLLLLIALPLIAYWAAQKIAQRVTLSRAQYRWLIVSIAALMAVAVLIALGRVPFQFILAPLGLAATTLFRALPALLRFLPMLQILKERSSAAQTRSPGQGSTIRTRYLAMRLDHESGALQGEVLEGAFAGQTLSSLAKAQLLELLQEVAAESESVQLLQAYLSREHPGWEEDAQHSGAGRAAEINDSTMTREHALEILGLAEGAERAAIVAAHRDLMRKLHPDRGGKDYLAKRVNAAKDFLLE